MKLFPETRRSEMKVVININVSKQGNVRVIFVRITNTD
jgi:hypothetical protein